MIVYEGKSCPPPEGYIAIVVAKFNRTITQQLLDGALAKLKAYQVAESDIRICWVPGAFELPIIAKRFAEQNDCAAVICLGAVIKGETSHDQHINRAISTELCRIGIDTGTPTIFGVLTCNTVEQALVRSGITEQSRDKSLDPTAGNKGAEAAETALEMLDLFTELPFASVTGNKFLDNFLNNIADPDMMDDDDDDDGMDWDDDDEPF